MRLANSLCNPCWRCINRLWWRCTWRYCAKPISSLFPVFLFGLKQGHASTLRACARFRQRWMCAMPESIRYGDPWTATCLANVPRPGDWLGIVISRHRWRLTNASCNGFVAARCCRCWSTVASLLDPFFVSIYWVLCSHSLRLSVKTDWLLCGNGLWEQNELRALELIIVSNASLWVMNTEHSELTTAYFNRPSKAMK